MANYTGFAYLYDLLMKDVPYQTWANYIDRVIRQRLEQQKTPIVLDLACGTGNITLPLAKLGYDMIGVDISTDMLSQAQAKIDTEKILFLAQDIRHLDLYGTVDAAVCACDGLNYILDEAELEAVFMRVKMFLNPGGVFIFDMNTEYKFKEVLGGKCFTADVEGISYEWDNHYNEDTKINMYHVLFTPKDGKPFVEVHHQRAYPLGLVCGLLKNAGFQTVTMHDGYQDKLPDDDCARAVFLCTT